MFLETSRYFQQKTVNVITKNNRGVKAVKLRRLPALEGKNVVVQGDDRLDIIAHRQYGDATRFWHIADANTELEARELVSETGREINIPE